MKILRLSIVYVVIYFINAEKSGTNQADQPQLGYCSWGYAAISNCDDKNCDEIGYICDEATNKCCLPDDDGHFSNQTHKSGKSVRAKPFYPNARNVGSQVRTPISQTSPQTNKQTKSFPNTQSSRQLSGISNTGTQFSRGYGQSNVVANRQVTGYSVSSSAQVPRSVAQKTNPQTGKPAQIVAQNNFKPPIQPTHTNRDLEKCSWGQPVVENCNAFGSCTTPGHVCDNKNNKCCRPAGSAALPVTNAAKTMPNNAGNIGGKTIATNTANKNALPKISGTNKAGPRANVGACTWGSPAVAACFAGQTCNLGYVCDTSINRCCLPSTTTTVVGSTNLGTCSWGQTAVAACFAGGFCGAGYQCDTRIQRCCLPGGIINPPANLGLCSWGQPAISVCQPGGTCSNPAYQCDLVNNRCCLPGTINPPPPTALTCQDGNPASTYCTNGLCGLGYTCSISDNLCCLSGTAASCNFIAFPSGQCNNGVCPGGSYCSADGYCCPGTSPVQPPPQPPIGGGLCPNNALSGGPCDINTPCADNNFVCINNECCQLVGLRCNNGVTAPTGLCVGGACPQQLPDGTIQSQVCEQPFNLCCPV